MTDQTISEQLERAEQATLTDYEYVALVEVGALIPASFVEDTTDPRGVLGGHLRDQIDWPATAMTEIHLNEAPKPNLYEIRATERGRPDEHCECDDCDCSLHTYPEDDDCVWCRNGDHGGGE